MTARGGVSRLTLLAVFAASGSALAFEIVVLRLLSIQHWQQFAAMVIGIALLGYAAAGVALARIRPDPKLVMRVALLCQAGSLPICMLLAQRSGFNELEIIWDPWQIARMALMVGLLSMPFLCAGVTIVTAFRSASRESGWIYGVDLSAAAGGAAMAVWLLVRMPPAIAMTVCAGIPWLVATAPWGIRERPFRAASLVVLVLFLVAVGSGEPSLRLSPYKGQAVALEAGGAQLVAERSTAEGYFAIVDNRRIPIRHAPGMSIALGREPPHQMALFTDGDAMAPISESGDSAWLHHSLGSVPYALGAVRSVLILGAGAGADVLRARYFQSGEITAVEPSRAVLELVQEHAGDREALQADWVVSGLRDYLSQTTRQFDLVVAGSSASLTASASGIAAARPSYLFTVEAIESAMDALNPEGMLVYTRWLQNPPRQTLKLLSGIIETLANQSTVVQPAARIAVLRTWNVAIILVGKRALSADSIKQIGDFAAAHGFDVVWPRAAGLTTELSPPRDWLQRAVDAWLTTASDNIVEPYPFDIRAATDDRPWFDNTFRWQTLPTLWEQRDRGGLGLLEAGYLIVFANIMIASLAGLGLLGLAISSLRATPRPIAMATSSYFTLIGIGFLGLEILMILKLELWLGRPTLAFAVGLIAFLLGGGLGAALQHSIVRRSSSQSWFATSVLVVVAGTWLLAAVMPVIDGFMLAQSLAVRTLLSALGILVLAFGMGQFLPLAMSSLGRRAPELLPWAWAVNGASSVVAAPLVLLAAMHIGLRASIVASGVLYLLLLAPPLQRLACQAPKQLLRK